MTSESIESLGHAFEDPIKDKRNFFTPYCVPCGLVGEFL